jgi:hypothetical protein
MRIVMDFDGVFTDPSDEGDACSKYFRDSILELGLKELDLGTANQVDSWLGECRARQASQPFHFGWRSEGRISAFTFEDPFIRNIGLADFLDSLVAQKDQRATRVLKELEKTHKIKTFGELSERSFHQITLKKRPDPSAKAWVMSAIEKGHELFIVSNSAGEKIEAFLNQNGYPEDKRPKVSGGARKFGLGEKGNPLLVADDGNVKVVIDTNRPLYENALMEIKPDLVIGDVFSLDLALPIRLKREGKLELKGGIFYKQRDYTPSVLLYLISGRASKLKQATVVRDWPEMKA